MAGHRAELQVDVEIDIPGLTLGVGFLARNRCLEKAATIEHIAAHRHLQHAVGAALGFQRGLVAFGRRIGREVGVHQIAVLIDLQRSLDRCAGTIDDDVFEPGRLLFLHHIEDGAARLARHLEPARQDVIELQCRQIGFDAHAAVAIGTANLADQLDRNCA